MGRNCDVASEVMPDRYSADACMENYRRLASRRQMEMCMRSPEAGKTTLLDRDVKSSTATLNSSRSVPTLNPQQPTTGALASLFAPIARALRVKTGTCAQQTSDGAGW